MSKAFMDDYVSTRIHGLKEPWCLNLIMREHGDGGSWLGRLIEG